MNKSTRNVVGSTTNSATERLRALLTERGVEWMPIAWNPKRETFYHTPNGIGFCADEYTDGVRIYTDATITTEQAIDATLGPGTCHVTDNGPWGYPYVCSVCGASFDPDVNNEEMNYCPNCGRAVTAD